MLYDIYNDSLKATVNDEGAELWSLLDILNDRELIWQGDRTIWPRRSPILSLGVGLFGMVISNLTAVISLLEFMALPEIISIDWYLKRKTA